MKVKSLKLKVKSSLEKLFTVHCSLFTAKAGFTLIEIVMIIVIVSIAIPTLLIVLGQGARQSVDAELQVSATNVGQAMMEEIKTKCWDETSTTAPNCGGAVTPSAIGTDGAGETWNINHTNYDDVDDYHDLYANSGSLDSVSIGATYTRDVQVCYVNPPPPNDALNNCIAGPTDYKKITVIVSNTTLGSVELVTVVTNY